MKWREDCEAHGPNAKESQEPAKRQDAIQALNRARKVLGYDTMITAANTLGASPKLSYGPHKASERYLDDEDIEKAMELYQILVKAGTKEAWLTHDMKIESLNLETIGALLQALETLRTHLRKKYYGG